MEVKATSKYSIISPKKVWRVSRALKGFSYRKAMEILREVNAKPARLLEKLLRSTYFNAVQKNSNLTEDDMFVKEIWVGQGPVMKRMMPRAQGKADVVRKPTSHVSVILVEGKER